jgi:tetratricopeptide (TPR) repeat protein
MRKTLVHLLVLSAVVLALGVPGTVLAVGSDPPKPAAPAPARQDPGDAAYRSGLQAKEAKRFADAVPAFQQAVRQRPNFPEAWNELGYALRQTGRYQEALKAYDEALRLRPSFPEAMEYLGEAYVKLGRLDDARALLERLKRLDPARAQELDEAIKSGK